MALNHLTNSLYWTFLTTSFYTTSLSLLKSTWVVFNLTISKLSTSDFESVISSFSAIWDVLTPVNIYSDFAA